MLYISGNPLISCTLFPSGNWSFYYQLTPITYHGQFLRKLNNKTNKPTHHQTGPQTGEQYFQTGLLELSPPEKEFSDEYVFIIHHLTE